MFSLFKSLESPFVTFCSNGKSFAARPAHPGKKQKDDLRFPFDREDGIQRVVSLKRVALVGSSVMHNVKLKNVEPNMYIRLPFVTLLGRSLRGKAQ